MNRIPLFAFIISLLANSAFAQLAQRIELHPKLTHLRNEPTREWSTFPEQAENTRLEVRFVAQANAVEFALRLRQQDVKQLWRVLLNGKSLGELIRDEADIVFYLPIPPRVLKDGENTLLIEAKAGSKPAADDIRVGEIQLAAKSVREVLSAATCEIQVHDAESKSPLPARLTIVSRDGALQTTSATSAKHLAVRPGVIYTADGRATFSLPAGEYTIYAGRGFEYSVDRTAVKIAAGESVQRILKIRREVPTPGLVACDTHIHTFTHSGHGDATIDERMITLAGEGIELPIATDHNKHIDYRPIAERLKLSRHFTPVMGNEVTTPVGHFNVFPVGDGARVPNHQLQDWASIHREIFETPGVQVCILNHARDIHSGVRPFGPDLFNATIGENFAGWPMVPNAMEVINSGATQNEPLQLLHDWLALLNRGYQVTPVGSSDSHDVSRYIVGQGRTYIRAGDGDVGQLDVNTALKNFLAGRVAVSYGLLVDLTIDDQFAAGDLATGKADEVAVQLRVLGPHWTTAKSLRLYSNGQLLREAKIEPPADRSPTPGVQWEGVWKIPRPKHDVHLVAVALGKGIDAPYWATALPYQPTSPTFEGVTLGASGAVWIDGDHDGQRTSARGYADRLAKDAGTDAAKLVTSLVPFDAAVAAQAMHLYLSAHQLPVDEFEKVLQPATPAVASGMRAAWQAFREQELARARLGMPVGGQPKKPTVAEELATFKIESATIAKNWQKEKILPEFEPPEFPFTAKIAGEYQRACALWLGVPITWKGPLGIEFVLIPPGEFVMGSPDAEPDRAADETSHRVRLTKAFYLAKHETTFAQFRAFVEATQYVTDGEKNGGGHAHDDQAVWQHRAGTNWRKPGFAGEFAQGDRQPVVHVSHTDALAFSNWLAESASPPFTINLPSEAEWEWACRAGTATRFTWGNDIDTTGKVANVGDQKLKAVQPKWPREIMAMNDGYAFLAPVGSYRANAFQLHDMLGNVWEFCGTRSGPYPTDVATDPGDLAAGRGFAVRGGGWSNIARDVRSATRNADPPHFCHSNLGFRIALRLR